MTHDQATLFPTERPGNDATTATMPASSSRRLPAGPSPAGPGHTLRPSARRLRKYDRHGKLTLQYRILKRLANHGRITSTELNRAGETDWHVQRSAGQRLRDVRSVFGLDLRRTTRDGITTWSLGMGDRITARELITEAARRAPRKRRR